jgi:hypothetical protein
MRYFSDVYVETLTYSATNNIPAIAVANNISGSVLIDLKGFTITGGGETGQSNISLGISFGYYNGPQANPNPIIITNGTLTNFTVAVDGAQGGRANLANVTLILPLSIERPSQRQKPYNINVFSFRIPNFVTPIIESARTPAQITPYPTGRLFWGGAVPGTSCQATIAPSLRDISQQALSSPNSATPSSIAC